MTTSQTGSSECWMDARQSQKDQSSSPSHPVSDEQKNVSVVGWSRGLELVANRSLAGGTFKTDNRFPTKTGHFYKSTYYPFTMRATRSTLSQRKDRAPQPPIMISCQAGGVSPVGGGVASQGGQLARGG